MRNLLPLLTRVVLVNANYLKAQWAAQFEPSEPHPDAFVGRITDPAAT